MVEIITIGLDIAKSVFQVHGVDASGSVEVRRQLRRAELLKYFGSLPRCLVAGPRAMDETSRDHAQSYRGARGFRHAAA